ncbi:hypothetical protein [Streptomyces longisporus]|uniref:Transmembrane protein n=1 Tax=Streptomyces longisporus TaxID=1948 RepID=A0ABP5Y2Y5_STRLO
MQYIPELAGPKHLLRALRILPFITSAVLLTSVWLPWVLLSESGQKKVTGFVKQLTEWTRGADGSSASDTVSHAWDSQTREGSVDGVAIWVIAAIVAAIAAVGVATLVVRTLLEHLSRLSQPWHRVFQVWRSSRRRLPGGRETGTNSTPPGPPLDDDDWEDE